jgi:hypothetical protein
MNTITEKELLDFCYRSAKKLAESQYFEIDENYNLIRLNGRYQPSFIVNYKPIITFEDNDNFILIKIKYNTKPFTELILTNAKWIVKEGKYYQFDSIED